MEQTIKNRLGQVLGTIRDEGDRQVARDFYGRIVGYYRKRDDVTTDENGLIVTRGNTLAGLIPQDWQR